jgi:hypothetical protein
MLQGYKTWIGLIMTILGTLGLFEKLGVSQDQVSKIIDAGMQLFGLVYAAYGNWDAHRRLKELQY